MDIFDIDIESINDCEELIFIGNTVYNELTTIRQDLIFVDKQLYALSLINPNTEKDNMCMSVLNNNLYTELGYLNTLFSQFMQLFIDVTNRINILDSSDEKELE